MEATTLPISDRPKDDPVYPHIPGTLSLHHFLTLLLELQRARSSFLGCELTQLCASPNTSWLRLAGARVWADFTRKCCCGPMMLPGLHIRIHPIASSAVKPYFAIK
jgi:hypothetical protein